MHVNVITCTPYKVYVNVYWCTQIRCTLISMLLFFSSLYLHLIQTTLLTLLRGHKHLEQCHFLGWEKTHQSCFPSVASQYPCGPAACGTKLVQGLPCLGQECWGRQDICTFVLPYMWNYETIVMGWNKLVPVSWIMVTMEQLLWGWISLGFEVTCQKFRKHHIIS